MGLALCPGRLYMAVQWLPLHPAIAIFGGRDEHTGSHHYPFLQTFLILSVRKNELPTSTALVFTWDFFIVLGIRGFP